MHTQHPDTGFLVPFSNRKNQGEMTEALEVPGSQSAKKQTKNPKANPQ